MGEDENPICGDVLALSIRVERSVIADAGFEASGCAPSIAAGDAVAEMIIGLTVQDAADISLDQIDECLGGLPRTKRHSAQLAVMVLSKAIADYERRRES